MASINPSSLFYVAASPQSAASPASSTAQPSRKRPRTDFQSSEERKEARAERNRIAAQVSRDRRKAEFGDLRDRVTELERENAALRAGLSPASTSTAAAATATTTAPIGTNINTVEIERENRELKERVRVLENTLATLSENVVNALQGIGAGMGPLSHLIASASSRPTQKTMTTVPTTPAPALSGLSSTSSNASSSLVGVSSEASSSTRHLAAGGASGKNSLFDVSSPTSTASNIASDFPVCNYITSDTISPAHANTEDWLRAIIESNNNTTNSAPIVAASSPSTSSLTASPFILQPSSPSSSSSTDTDLSAILSTPLVETRSPLLTMNSSSPVDALMNGSFEMTSLFGDDRDTEMEKLLAMIPASGSTDAPTVTGTEDLWMSNWLKEEPMTQGASVF